MKFSLLTVVVHFVSADALNLPLSKSVVHAVPNAPALIVVGFGDDDDVFGAIVLALGGVRSTYIRKGLPEPDLTSFCPSLSARQNPQTCSPCDHQALPGIRRQSSQQCVALSSGQA